MNLQPLISKWNTSSQISNPRQKASKREITDLKKSWTSELIINENLCIWQEPLKPENQPTKKFMFNLNSKIDHSFVLQKHTYYDKLQLLPHTSKIEKNQSARNKVKEPLNKHYFQL